MRYWAEGTGSNTILLQKPPSTFKSLKNYEASC